VLIASGTLATPLSNIASDGETIITSDDIGELKRLPRSLAVVGAGVIGIEYASMFASLGIEVTVIDRRDRPLEFVDAEIVDELIHQMRKRNVNFRFGEAVEGVTVNEGPPKRAVISSPASRERSRRASARSTSAASRVSPTSSSATKARGPTSRAASTGTSDDFASTTFPRPSS